MSAVSANSDERVSLNGLVTHVKDADRSAIGSWLSSRELLALLRALIRAGRRNHLGVGSAHGIPFDPLGPGTVVKAVAGYDPPSAPGDAATVLAAHTPALFADSTYIGKRRSFACTLLPPADAATTMDRSSSFAARKPPIFADIRKGLRTWSM